MSADVFRRFSVQVRGKGPDTLVFAHGLGCDRRLWRFVAPRFETTHRVVLFDLVGSGGSDLAAYDPQRHASLELSRIEAGRVGRCDGAPGRAGAPRGLPRLLDQAAGRRAREA